MYKQSILKVESPLFIVLKSDVALVALITFLYVIPNMAIFGLFLRTIWCLTVARGTSLPFRSTTWRRFYTKKLVLGSPFINCNPPQ